MTHDHKPPDPPSLLEVAAMLAREGKGAAARAVRDAYDQLREDNCQDCKKTENDLRVEKRRRVYYQSIVYDVCRMLDDYAGNHITKGEGVVCGTADTPSQGVQREILKVLRLARGNTSGAQGTADVSGVSQVPAGGEVDRQPLVGRCRVAVSAEYTCPKCGWPMANSTNES